MPEEARVELVRYRACSSNRTILIRPLLIPIMFHFLQVQRRLLMSLFILAAGIGPALSYSVKGVIAGGDGQSCPGAVYSIYLLPDTVSNIAIEASGNDGEFVRHLRNTGRYQLRTSYVGYKPKSVDFMITDSCPDVDLDTIRLDSEAETLGEVVVAVRRKLVESDGAKLTYNVEEDPMAQNNTILELLRRVPMVTVDANDDIKVKGESNFKIYLNGKEDPMLSGDVKTALKSIPATSIKKIEVITEPGARYDAEGVGGILNIVTDQKRTIEGYNATVNLWGNNRSYGGGAYARTKIRNVTASININGSDGTWARLRNRSSSVTENLQSETDRYQRTDSESYSQWYYYGGNFNLSWEPDTLNLFTLSANYSRNPYNSTSEQTQMMESLAGERRWRFDRHDKSKGLYEGFGLQASFQHTFRKEGHTLTGSYLFNHGVSDDSDDQSRDNIEGIDLPFMYAENISDNSSHRHTGQLDYVLPINDRHTFEAGLKGNWNESHNDSRPYYGVTAGELVLDEDERVKSTQFQDILAVYVTWRGSFGKFVADVGIRYEHTRMGMHYKVGKYRDFTRFLNDPVPNAALTYRLTDANSIRLAYQMRIFRPWLSAMNPYRNEMTVGEVSYGNPDLESEKYHSLNLKYSSWGGGKIGWEVTLGYSMNNNSIEDYEFMEDGIRNMSWANIGHVQSADLSAYVNWTVIRDMSISLYAGGSYRDLKADSPMLKAHNSGWRGNFNLDWNYRLPFGLRVNCFGGGGTKWISLQYSGSGWYYYGLQFSKGFLKDEALNINLYAQQFLTPSRTSRSTTVAENMIVRSVSTYKQWNLGVGISWRFGSLKANVRQTAAKIDDDGGGGKSSKSQQGGN